MRFEARLWEVPDQTRALRQRLASQHATTTTTTTTITAEENVSIGLQSMPRQSTNADSPPEILDEHPAD